VFEWTQKPYNDLQLQIVFELLFKKVLVSCTTKKGLAISAIIYLNRLQRYPNRWSNFEEAKYRVDGSKFYEKYAKR
jgi:hypothetical protein